MLTLSALSSTYRAEDRAPLPLPEAYDADLAGFRLWRAERVLPSLPSSAPVVAIDLTFLAGSGRKAATIERARAGIVYAHQRQATGFAPAIQLWPA